MIDRRDYRRRCFLALVPLLFILALGLTTPIFAFADGMLFEYDTMFSFAIPDIEVPPANNPGHNPGNPGHNPGNPPGVYWLASVLPYVFVGIAIFLLITGIVAGSIGTVIVAVLIAVVGIVGASIIQSLVDVIFTIH